VKKKELVVTVCVVVYADLTLVSIDNNDIYLPVMLPSMPPAFSVMLLSFSDALPAIPLKLPVMLPPIPLMFAANTTVPIAGTSNTANANVIANDKIRVLAIFIRNDTTLFKYFPRI
jgi:hypothetical protein